MFELNEYLDRLIAECRNAFGERLLYVGLQGSYMRQEAHENSDIDVMVIIDGFTVADMDTYKQILRKAGHFEKSCGFICGRKEMMRWNPLEICQLRHTTKDLFGSLSDYLPEAKREDELNYVRLSLGNLYHEICHRYIHADKEKNIAAFRASCKAVFFLIQNLHYLESGRFILTRKELKDALCPSDRQVLELAQLPDGFDFDEAFSVLFAWCQKAFERCENLTGKDYPVRLLREEEIPEALDLAWKVFCEYEAPAYCAQGTEEFRRCLNDESWLKGIVYYGAFDGERLAGMLGIRKESRHICLFFVDGQYHRRGIGTRLFQNVQKDYPKQRITLNSSPYGLPFYKALGFLATDCEQTVHGIRFTPMEYGGGTIS